MGGPLKTTIYPCKRLFSKQGKVYKHCESLLLAARTQLCAQRWVREPTVLHGGFHLETHLGFGRRKMSFRPMRLSLSEEQSRNALSSFSGDIFIHRFVQWYGRMTLPAFAEMDFFLPPRSLSLQSTYFQLERGKWED